MEIFLKFFTLDDLFIFACLAVIGSVGAFVKFVIVNYNFEQKAHELKYWPEFY